MLLRMKKTVEEKLWGAEIENYSDEDAKRVGKECSGKYAQWKCCVREKGFAGCKNGQLDEYYSCMAEFNKIVTYLEDNPEKLKNKA
jgi:hypothetical protein